ncbi:MAG: hemolysin family protein [Candidatus Poribacteria bacterium]|nr:hemolysin family protein [Candidatus Poribacteria bacterium]MDE0502901.1 hemolysin family protein [Candidatus Poribacteria bacterium]
MNRVQVSTVVFILVCCVFLAGSTSHNGLEATRENNILQFAILLGGLTIFVVLSAFYSGSETATVSLDRLKIYQLAEQGDKKAQIVKKLVDTPEKTLGMTLVGTNIANVLASQMGLLFVIALLQMSTIVQTILASLRTNEQAAATLISTGLILVFGELLPKTIFRVKANSLALRYAVPLRISNIILRPIVNGISYLTGFLVRIGQKRAAPAAPDTQRDELRLLASMGEQSGGILEDQRRMIHSVLNLHNRTVEQVMVPLVDIVAVERDTNVDTFLKIAAEAGYSRIPVFEDQVNNVIGIVHLLDIIYSNDDSKRLESFIRPNLHFVPASKPTNVLLKEIQQSHHTMVFVVDEYGGVVGLSTVEDLLEEIVGELSDERDQRDDPEVAHVIGPRLLECDGRTEIGILSDKYEVPIPVGDYETVAGFVLDRVGNIPNPGDKIETDDFVITVSDADARSIRKVRIRRKSGSFAKIEAQRQGLVTNCV